MIVHDGIYYNLIENTVKIFELQLFQASILPQYVEIFLQFVLMLLHNTIIVLSIFIFILMYMYLLKFF